jgi:hypothetical protein
MSWASGAEVPTATQSTFDAPVSIATAAANAEGVTVWRAELIASCASASTLSRTVTGSSVLVTSPWTVRGRGPHRIDPYLADASSQGIVRIVTVAPERKELEVTDAEPIKAMTRRLVAVLDDPAPRFKDVSFAVLADAAGIARPHL